MAVEDHPRACGEQSAPAGPCGPLMGSLPRVRGTGRGLGAGQPVPGITPARAGNRESWFTGLSQRRDHPRACGEQTLPHSPHPLRRGSPPRVRGTDVDIFELPESIGITPARAGNRQFKFHFFYPSKDHPRACGEQVHVPLHSFPVPGSPPRVRGTERGNFGVDEAKRITPARAGNRYFP